jgi:hypothetical protein
VSVIRWQRCTGCEVEKAHTLRNFYRCKTGRYGLRIKCKVCCRKDVYENRALKSDYYRAYYRRRNRDDPKRAAQIRAWRQTPAGREATRLSNRIYYRFKALEMRA